MEPLVSIIIPVYNSGKFLPETMDSVQKQSHKNIEVILIDNGSDDGPTLDLLKSLEKDFSVTFLDKTSVSEARNTGIKKAKGEYILALDSDDIIDPTFIEKCVQQISANQEISVVRTQIELFGKKTGVMNFVEYDFSILLARNLMVVTSLFRKSDWEKIGGFDPAFINGFEDWEFWINLLKEGGKVATIQEPLFKYRIRKDSRNSALRQSDLADLRKQIWEKHKSLYATHFMDPRESFEYKFMTDSKAHKIGSLLLKPFSKFKLMK